jgi:hypothetical protein
VGSTSFTKDNLAGLLIEYLFHAISDDFLIVNYEDFSDLVQHFSQYQPPLSLVRN